MSKKNNSPQDVLDSTFARINDIDSTEIELRADFSRYLCVLVSGYLEQYVRSSTAKYVKERSQPQIADFVVSQTNRITNLNCEKITKHYVALNKNWQKLLDELLVDEAKDAINSIVALRHSIAHGQSADVTYERVSRYYKQVKRVIFEIDTMLNL
ncbi:HEPN domain-containing protein [Duganella sp. BJB476]|uniref:HEPN domain-containing protein n=1 Tax=Duganella sp. BJB476 TaxID=1871176 RepID=UPI0011C1A693|nr:HEPN domain-containing protein [Duganella sp. BJB476]